MTPTMLGRWHTRLLLFVLLGLPITFVYGLYLNNWTFPPFPTIEITRWPPVDFSQFPSAMRDPFVFITAILALGLVMDIVYIQIQRFRWDQDWPFAFQFVVSILEFLAIYGLMDLGYLDFALPDGRIDFLTAVYHFTWVFIPSFLALLGGVQLFLVRWRFKGGELGRMRAAN